jgi:colicin import membrane protein
MSKRDPFMPPRVQRTGPALGLAVLAHLLLIAALAFGVNWRDTEPTSIAAELWSAVPQAAAPRAVEVPTPPPAPQPAEVRKPEPVVVPKPQAPAVPDPQIAIEKAKREEAKRRQAEEDEKARQEKLADEKREKEELAKKKAAADKLAKEKADAEKADKLAKEKADKAEATRQAALREANLKRMQGLADATGGPTDSGTALQSSAPSAGYAGRIVARIRPNIVLTDPVNGNPRAVVEIKLAPDGTIIDKTLRESSGSKTWDEAVLRAIDRTGILPRDVDGRVRTPIVIGFRPND